MSSGGMRWTVHEGYMLDDIVFVNLLILIVILRVIKSSCSLVKKRLKIVGLVT
jgi:hypothetical protein